jgi:rhodanese-related sulfurtransferase
MLNLNKQKEEDNTRAVFIGVFLIILIATITVFKSNSEKKSLSKKNKEISSQVESPSEIKIKKISVEELAKKVQANSDLLLLDLRGENQYATEHIINSISLADLRIDSVDKNKPCILIDASGEAETINTAGNALTNNGLKNLLYLEGGFDSWKKKFNPTISGGDPDSFTDQAKVTYLTSDDLKKMMAQEKNLLIIDVRKNAEFNTGHIAGAINIFLNDLEKKRRELSFGKKIILYDNDNLGAFKGAVRLFDLGFMNTLALSDGLATWKIKGYELVK